MQRKNVRDIAQGLLNTVTPPGSHLVHPPPPLGPLLKQGAGESDEAFDARINATVGGGS